MQSSRVNEVKVNVILHSNSSQLIKIHPAANEVGGDRATPQATPTTVEENGGVFVGEFSDDGDDIIGDLENEVMKSATVFPRTRQLVPLFNCQKLLQILRWRGEAHTFPTTYYSFLPPTLSPLPPLSLPPPSLSSLQSNSRFVRHSGIHGQQCGVWLSSSSHASLLLQPSKRSCW